MCNLQQQATIRNKQTTELKRYKFANLRLRETNKRSLRVCVLLDKGGGRWERRSKVPRVTFFTKQDFNPSVYKPH